MELYWLIDLNMENFLKQLVIVKADKNHGFSSFADARKWAKNNIVGIVQHHDIGEINISKAAIDKYLSEKAVEKSDSIDVHFSALRKIPEIIVKSVVGEIHADRKNDAPLKDIVLLYSAMDIDGKMYRIKTTVKRYNDIMTKTKAYSYEVKEMRLLDVELGNEIMHIKRMLAKASC